MLVLTRRVGEVIVIGLNVRITVAAIRGDKVRLAIDAPRSVRVDREEIRARIDADIEPTDAAAVATGAK